MVEINVSRHKISEFKSQSINQTRRLEKQGNKKRKTQNRTRGAQEWVRWGQGRSRDVTKGIKVSIKGALGTLCCLLPC